MRPKTAEGRRLAEARRGSRPWKKFGPYLSERQWGTVREDYSPNGDSWAYFGHDQSHARAYRWGEDGLAGFADEKARLCFAVALWNGADRILKERAFGLTNAQGNHGEDVKEYYWYLDSTPTHSYMKYLYRYPQSAFPYDDLIETNAGRGFDDPEYELIDTGIFDANRYFDVFVEYAKAGPTDFLIRITALNRGPEAAELHLLPTLWFRNTWSWGYDDYRPVIRRLGDEGRGALAEHRDLGEFRFHWDGDAEGLYTENETNNEWLFGGANATPYTKDGIARCVIHGQREAVNAEGSGTKLAPHFQLSLAAGESRSIRLRLGDHGHTSANRAFRGFDATFERRRCEADRFYANVIPPNLSEDEQGVIRQALAGMLWTKQFYYIDVDLWLREHGAIAVKEGIDKILLRNKEWFHMINEHVISMPDKWEYPWYAAWDLAFHAIPLAMVDIDFAKQQLDLMLDSMYQHPNGQIPAYEWNFSDVNPPVHAFATQFVYDFEKSLSDGRGDVDFLEHSFQKLLLNFSWWVNRKDRTGNNVFEGGFLGLDNIGVFDRSRALPVGGFLEQADGTAWMALFSQNLLEMALELSVHKPVYEDMALRFAERFLWIGAAMGRVGENQEFLWDEEDGFFYDVLRFEEGGGVRLKVRSMVGLLPLCATLVLREQTLAGNPRLVERMEYRLRRMPELQDVLPHLGQPGPNGTRILSMLSETQLRRVLSRMLDESEFLSPYGIRSLSRFHADHPYTWHVGDKEYSVAYLPAESDSGMFGGNSNWRGPVWFPVNALIIRALLQFHFHYGDSFKVEFPTGSGKEMTLFQVAQEITGRLSRIFLLDDNGRRPVFGSNDTLQTDPAWRDNVLFYEYFHGDNGSGIGASHQTGWTGLVAPLMRFFASTTPEQFLELGKQAAAYDRKR